MERQEVTQISEADNHVKIKTIPILLSIVTDKEFFDMTLFFLDQLINAVMSIECGITHFEILIDCCLNYFMIKIFFVI